MDHGDGVLMASRFPPGWTDQDEEDYRTTVAESGGRPPTRAQVKRASNPGLRATFKRCNCGIGDEGPDAAWLEKSERRMHLLSTIYATSRLIRDSGRKYERIWRQTDVDVAAESRGSIWRFVNRATGDVHNAKDRNTPKGSPVENIFRN